MINITKLGSRFCPLAIRKYNNFTLRSFLAFQTVIFISHHQKALLSTVNACPFHVPEEVVEQSKKNKIILVLDLDQTLVYTRRTTKPNHSNYIEVQFEGYPLYIEYRPYLFEFLQAVSKIFTVYVYTAGRKPYADLVLDVVDRERVIQKRFYRESCRKYGGSLLKDLKLIREKEKEGRMVLVDDNSQSIAYNHPHSIRIRRFEGDQSDAYFINIYKHLLSLYQK